MPSVYWRASSLQGCTATDLTGLNATTGVTVAWWMQPLLETALINAFIFGQWSTANAGRDGYSVRVSNGQLVLRVQGSAGANDTTFSVALSRVIHNQWGHCAVTFDDATDTVLLYRNGMLVARGANTRDMTSNASCTTTLCANTLDGPFSGNLFDLQVLPDVVVPSSDIPLLMNPTVQYPGVKARYGGLAFKGTTTVPDESGNGNTLTVTTVNVQAGDEPPLRPTLA